MRQKIVILLLILSLFLTACRSANTEMVPHGFEQGMISEQDNQSFQTRIIGSISHGIQEYSVDKKTGDAFLQYKGDEIEIKYRVSVSNMQQTGVGLMIFVGGKPQAYRTDSSTEYKYMHTFYFANDCDNDLSLYFIPSIGAKGDELGLCITSVYHPEYKPDMESNRGYGMYHDMVENMYVLKYECTPPIHQQDVQTQGIRDLGISQYMMNSNTETTDYRRNDNWYSLSIDNTDVSLGNCYEINSAMSSLHFTFTINDLPSAIYRCSLYADHVPLFWGTENSVELDVSSNERIILDAYIDVDTLSNYSSFYIVVTPCLPDGDGIVGLRKTNSVLLIKETSSSAVSPQTPPVQRIDRCLEDYNGYVCPVGDDEILLYSDTIQLMKRNTLEIVAEGSCEELPATNYSFCTACKNEEGYTIGGYLTDDDGKNRRLHILLLDRDLQMRNILSVMELLDDEQEILNYRLAENGKKLLFSTWDGLYLYDFITKELMHLAEGDQYFCYFDYAKDKNKVVFVSVDHTSDRILGEVDIENHVSVKAVAKSAPYGEVYAYGNFALIQEEELYGREKEGVVYLYDYLNGVTGYPLSDPDERVEISVSEEGNYYATKLRDREKGYTIKVYSTVDHCLCQSIEVLGENGEYLSVSDVAISEKNQTMLLWGRSRTGDTLDTWLRVISLY